MNLPSDPAQMLQQAKEMQERLNTEIASIQVEASTGGGMVTVRMDGTKRVTGIVIEPVAAEDIEMLQDMVRGAFNEASKRVEEQMQQRLGGMLGDLGLPPGMMGT